MKGYHVTLVITALALLGTFCLRPPAFPQWDTTVNLPLYASTFRVVDFLDSARFHVNGDSTIDFSWSGTLDTVSADGVVDVIRVNESTNLALSDFVFSNLSPAQGGGGLEDIIGMPIPDTGLKMTLGPFSRVLVCPVALPGIDMVEVTSGVLVAQVSNRTGVAFDSVIVQLPFARVDLGLVAPRETSSRRIQLGGACIQSPLPVTILVGSPGVLDTVAMTKADSLLIEVSVDSLTIASGRVVLPAVQGKRQCRVALATSRPFRIDSMAVVQGSCRVRLSNDFSVPIDVSLHVPTLGRRFHEVLPAKGVKLVDIDLSGCRVDNHSRTNCLLEFEVVGVPISSGEFVELSKRDGLGISYQTDDLGLSMVAGEFTRPVYVTSMLESLPRFLPVGVTGVRVSEADVVLDLTSTIGFPLELLLELVAHRDGRETRREQRTLYIPAGSPGQSSRSEHILPIADLINTGPDAITIEHTVRILGRGSYEAGSYLNGRASLSTPLRMAFEADTVPGPTCFITLSPEHRRLLVEHLVEAEVTIQVRNGFAAPFCGTLRLAEDTVQGRKCDALEFPLAMPAGLRDERGNCVYPSDTVLTFTVDSFDVRLLARSTLNARVFIGLMPTDTFNIRASDGLSVDALLTLRARVAP